MIVDFYRNKVIREEVKKYIEDYFVERAVEMVFERKDVSHIADAKELLDGAFEKMEIEYGVKKEPINFNEAR